MATSRYDKGDLVQSAVVFTDENDTAADPTTVVFKWKIGKSGTETAYTYGVDAEVVKTAVGNYYVNLAIDQDNTIYYVGFYGTGTLIAADETLFRINKSYFD